MGGKFYKFNISGNDYELVDPNYFLIKMLTFKKEYYPKDWVKLFIIILVGSMGSGKSTIIDYITNRIHTVYGSELNAFKCNDLIYALKSGVDLNYFQEVIIDDAMQKGFDARQSMSGENISMSQNFSIGRHIAKITMQKGILFVVFAIQSPTRLDKFIRENADLTIYKTYYPFLDKILDEEHLQYVKDFTRESMLENNLNELSACLGVDRIGRPIKFFFPREKCKIKINEIIPEENSFDPLIAELKKVYDENLTDKMIRAYIWNWSRENDVEINKKQTSEILNRLTYDYYFLSNSSSKNNDNDKISISNLTELHEKFDIPIIQLAPYYEKSQAQLYRDIEKEKNNSKDKDVVVFKETDELSLVETLQITRLKAVYEKAKIRVNELSEFDDPDSKLELTELNRQIMIIEDDLLSIIEK